MTIFAGDKERNLANTVMDWLLNLGYLGLFLGTFLAGTVLPLSSDILLVGMLAAKADPLICLPVAAVGNWLGAMTSYGSTNTAYGLRWSSGPPSSAWSA